MMISRPQPVVRIFSFCLFCVMACSSDAGGPALPDSTSHVDRPGITETEWHGYTRLDFVVEGRHALLIVPDSAAAGAPWVWRAEWFGDKHGPQVQLALLKLGWHVAYMNAKDMYGGPRALELFDAFYRHVTKTYGLKDRMIMEGFSRGGLYAFNFAATYPQRVSALYLDAPALDIESWPGRDHSRWQECLDSYGITEEALATAGVSPLDRAGKVISAGIPVFGVSGDADRIVPYGENLAKLKELYEDAGGTIEVILKPGGGHHPHSLDDPTPIVEFLLEHAK